MMVWTEVAACIQTEVLFSTGVWSYQDCNVHLAYLLGMVSGEQCVQCRNNDGL